MQPGAGLCLLPFAPLCVNLTESKFIPAFEFIVALIRKEKKSVFLA
ncbi:hypothetical protein SAMN05216315_10856 [Nitrosospira sp. Nsp18]|nr:hypothetical protein SAMN05216315_10856 [Nitrosospira sp. Nsp18]